MQKTYINYYETLEGDLHIYTNTSLKVSAGNTLHGTDYLKYLFTLEINEKGEPRIFKHELSKEPVKSYTNFYLDSKGSNEVFSATFKTKDLADVNAFCANFLFTKCFDETGKEYPIEGEE